ncbi:MAG: hypothetical protein P8X49_09525 [Syntrophobacterales bacterium]
MMPGRGHGHGHGHGYGHGCCRPGGGYYHHGGICCSGGTLPGCCPGLGWRRFMSPAEEMERLHEYLAELKKEVAGVEARIHELKGK